MSAAQDALQFVEDRLQRMHAMALMLDSYAATSDDNLEVVTTAAIIIEDQAREARERASELHDMLHPVVVPLAVPAVANKTARKKPKAKAVRK